MANIRCRCGTVLSDGVIPCRDEMVILPDTKVEPLTNAILDAIRRKGDLEVEITFLVESAGPTAYKCPACGRLLVFEDGLNKPSKSYRPE